MAIIGAANIPKSYTSNSSLKSNVTLSEITLLKSASAENGDEWWEEDIQPNHSQSGWQKFWASVGNFFSNVWSAITSFFSDWEIRPLYDDSGKEIGLEMRKSW
jgi:hypothetical protein